MTTGTTAATGDATRWEDRLVWAGVAFAVGSAIHIADHLRRGQTAVGEDVYILGNIGLVLQAVVITLILTRHRTAPAAAVAAGVPLAIGFFVVHWLPARSFVSDSLLEAGTSPLSYVASIAEIVGAVLIAIAGGALLRSGGLESVSARVDAAV